MLKNLLISLSDRERLHRVQQWYTCNWILLSALYLRVSTREFQIRKAGIEKKFEMQIIQMTVTGIQISLLYMLMARPSLDLKNKLSD